MSIRMATISVDLDEIDCYAEIHGIQQPELATSNLVYSKAIPRFERLFSTMGIPATFFVIGKHLSEDNNSKTIGRLYRQGYEVANHSANHYYDLTRMNPESIYREIREGSDSIAQSTGHKPIGFRAPGYTINQLVFEILTELGYQYDSSVFPCPLYYTAKVAAISAIRIAGRHSHSIPDTLLVLASPTGPYRVGIPYWRQGNGLLEFPVGVTRCYSGRLPYIGTSLILAGKTGSTILSKLMLGKPLINLVLHGIELLDADHDGIGFLRSHQPDLRVPWQSKESILRTSIQVIRDAGYQFVTLSRAAKTFADIL